MFTFETIVVVGIVWSVIGLFIALAVGDLFPMFAGAEGLEFVNPRFIYKHVHVNFFGCLLLTIACNLLCPIGSILYWMYKLATVRRR